MMTQTAPTPTPELKRRQRQYKQRRTAFANWRTGEVLLPDSTGRYHGVVHVSPRSVQLDDLLLMLPPQVSQLYLVGGDKAANVPDVTWWKQPIESGWTVAKLITTSRQAESGTRQAEYYRGTRRLTVRMSAPWFERATDLTTIATAYQQLEWELQQRFDEHATLLGTPAATGQDLLERSLPFKTSFPTMPSALRDILYTSMGQGRMELLTQTDVKRIPGLYQLDARWMYASCLSNLPVGLVEHRSWGDAGTDIGDAWLDYTPAFYRVRFWVPTDWQHIGLLSVLTGNASEGERKAPCWPSEPASGPFETWAGNATLAQAIDAGWPLLILERIAWPESGRQHGDPCAVWLKKLKALREQYTTQVTAPSHDVDELIVAAVRHLVIDTIGAWYTRERIIWHVTPISESGSVPDDAPELHVYGDRVEWTSVEEVKGDALARQHPEWACMVWDRARARLQKTAMLCRRETLIAARSDALLVSALPVGLPPDNGKPGAFRLKGASTNHEVTAPHSETELRLLRARIDAGRA